MMEIVLGRKTTALSARVLLGRGSQSKSAPPHQLSGTLHRQPSSPLLSRSHIKAPVSELGQRYHVPGIAKAELDEQPPST